MVRPEREHRKEVTGCRQAEFSSTDRSSTLSLKQVQCEFSRVTFVASASRDTKVGLVLNNSGKNASQKRSERRRRKRVPNKRS